MTTVTVTQYLDANPAPRVEVFVADPPAGTVTITRTADGRTMPVRGAIKHAAGSGVSVIDNDVPFGVQVTYQAELFDTGDVSTGFVTSAATILDVTDCWVHQPLDPRLAVRVDVTGDSADELVRGFDGELVYTDGATVGRWIGGRRHALEGVQLGLETSSTADMDVLQAMFGTYSVDQVPVVCIRTPPGFLRLPRTLFLAVPKPSENDINIRYGGSMSVLQVTGDESVPPAPALVKPLLSYADTDAFFGTYSAIDAYYGSYLARDRDYDKAGYAG
jgi:hypothetical protein